LSTAVVLDDHHQRATLHGREVDPFVECPGRSCAVTDVDEANPILLSHLERKCHASHHRNHVAEMRDLADESAL
jgi:hypothetical protein